MELEISETPAREQADMAPILGAKTSELEDRDTGPGLDRTCPPLGCTSASDELTLPDNASEETAPRIPTSELADAARAMSLDAAADMWLLLPVFDGR